MVVAKASSGAPVELFDPEEGQSLPVVEFVVMETFAMVRKEIKRS